MSRRASGAGSGSSRKRLGATGKSDSKPGDASKPKVGAPGSKLAPGLYLVATPIGNAQDITLRALDILKRADLVACEDTRVTGNLLSRHGIKARLAPYHDHNAERARPALLARLAGGEAVALVSDAGTPLLSDPGFKLVRACLDAGIAVTAAPGPSAAVAGLILSGLPTDRFFFGGFLPAKAEARTRALAGLAGVPATLVFFESAQRLAAALADMARVLGPRHAAVARELTKMFEEVRRGTLEELAARYRQEGPPKGEVVVVVAPPETEPAASDVDLDARLREALAGSSVRDAAAIVSEATGLPRRLVYSRALALGRKE
jgi:16S rRNA (cytidine1402-2'-O)-methyltransferase